MCIAKGEKNIAQYEKTYSARLKKNPTCNTLIMRKHGARWKKRSTIWDKLQRRVRKTTVQKETG